MNRSWVQIAVAVAVFGGFIAVVAFSEQMGQALAGAVVFIVGLMAIAFRQALAALQQRLAEVGWAPERWRGARPFTYLLWGIGVSMVGASWVWLAYADV